MVELTINNVQVQAEEGMTVLEAAKSVGVNISRRSVISRIYSPRADVASAWWK